MSFFEKHRVKPRDLSAAHNKGENEPGSQPSTVQATAPDPRGFRIEAQKPCWRLDELILSVEIREALHEASQTIMAAPLIESWLGNRDKVGRRIAVNFYGPAGTGKTCSADALADLLGLQVMKVNYADLESRFVGDTPKNVRFAFRQAQEANALLFFDEADSILSRRFTSMTQPNEAYINQTRSMMMLELDKFQGVVVFATNLQRNYDDAFVRRIAAHVRFTLPDRAQRVQLWQMYLPETLPRTPEATSEQLADLSDGFSPADIATAVRQAAVRAACRSQTEQRVTLADLMSVIRKIKQAQREVGSRLSSAPVESRIRELAPDQLPEELRNQSTTEA